MSINAQKLVAGWIREKAAGLHKQARFNNKNGYTTGPMARFVPRAAAAYMEAANLLETRANELEMETDDGGQEQSDKSRANELVEVASLEWWRLVLADKAKAIIRELEARVEELENAKPDPYLIELVQAMANRNRARADEAFRRLSRKTLKACKVAV
jgi:hydroxylamine reductase (hybrid-cluster protein)